jgi:hypothetical protein
MISKTTHIAITVTDSVKCDDVGKIIGNEKLLRY